MHFGTDILTNCGHVALLETIRCIITIGIEHGLPGSEGDVENRGPI